MHGALPDGHCLFYLRRNELTMTRDEIERVANAKYEDNTFAYKGFIAGARWRIESVWHKKFTVIPDVGRPALLELKDPDSHKIVYKIDIYSGYEWKGLTHYEYSGLIRFAYIDELIPERKEEKK